VHDCVYARGARLYPWEPLVIEYLREHCQLMSLVGGHRDLCGLLNFAWLRIRS
jgi:hypothetical protein